MKEVEADREVCIQAGNCVMVADSLFDQDDDGIVVVLVDDVPGDEEDKRARGRQDVPVAGAEDRRGVIAFRRAIAARVNRIGSKQGQR